MTTQGLTNPVAYRKKPVVIEAMELTRESLEDVKTWCDGQYWSQPPMRAITGLRIVTLEGQMNASFGDWIIKGVKGEFYPCKPDIFKAIYELDDIWATCDHMTSVPRGLQDREGCDD